METDIIDAPPDTSPPRFAGFWVRFFAAAIDGFILCLFNLLLDYTFGLSNGGSLYLPAALALVVWFGYFPFMESSTWQATIGKRVLGLQVVGPKRQRVFFFRALVRFFSKAFSWFLFIGFIMIAFDPEKRGLHDRLAHTWVLQT